MNTERQLLKAELADTKNKFDELSILTESRLLSIRAILNPYADNVIELNIDKAKVEMGDLHKNWMELKTLSGKIKMLEEALNG